MAAAGFVMAAGVSVVVCWLGIVLGPRLGLVDRPDGSLKPHDRPIAPLGGAGVFAGLHLGLGAAGAFDPGLFTATIIVWALGLVDDRFGLGPRVRLAGVGLAGMTLVAFSDVDLFSVMGAFWMLVVLVVVNATNLFDGLDGLLGSVAAVAMAGLWVLTLLHTDMSAALYLAPIGAVLGFVGWNWPPARIFLGDNGAYVVGVTLVWLGLNTAPSGAGSLLATALIGVPLLDLAVTVVRRLLSGADLTSGGRDHFYDRLGGTGMRTAAVTRAMTAAQAVWIAVLLAVAEIGSVQAAVATAGVLSLLALALLARFPRGAPPG